MDLFTVIWGVEIAAYLSMLAWICLSFQDGFMYEGKHRR